MIRSSDLTPAMARALEFYVRRYHNEPVVPTFTRSTAYALVRRGLITSDVEPQFCSPTPLGIDVYERQWTKAEAP
jgi:hypothetical protein